MELPTFRYHPDPVASGSVKASDAPCVCCKQAKGYVYAGPVYAEADYEETICPWCIADGSAHESLDATFVDSEALGDDVPADVIVEITTRTPGYASWQGEQWPSCCGDGSAFLKPVGIAEIRRDHYQWEVVSQFDILRVTPAMEAGVSNHVWSLEELASLAS